MTDPEEVDDELELLEEEDELLDELDEEEEDELEEPTRSGVQTRDPKRLGLLQLLAPPHQTTCEIRPVPPSRSLFPMSKPIVRLS